MKGNHVCTSLQKSELNCLTATAVLQCEGGQLPHHGRGGALRAHGHVRSAGPTSGANKTHPNWTHSV